MLRSFLPNCASVCRKCRVLFAHRNFASSGQQEESPTVGKPVEPTPEDCCQSGCRRCVWEIYLDDLAEWEKQNPTVWTASTNIVHQALSVSFYEAQLLTCQHSPSLLPALKGPSMGVTTSKALTELDPFLALELKLKQKDSNRNK